MIKAVFSPVFSCLYPSCPESMTRARNEQLRMIWEEN